MTFIIVITILYCAIFLKSLKTSFLQYAVLQQLEIEFKHVQLNFRRNLNFQLKRENEGPYKPITWKPQPLKGPQNPKFIQSQIHDKQNSLVKNKSCHFWLFQCVHYFMYFVLNQCF